MQNQLTTEFDAHDALWAEAVTIAEEYVGKANAQIALQCMDLVIPAAEAPRILTSWLSRGPSYADRTRRAELRKLAETRLTALTKTAKAAIGDRLLDVETELIAGGLQSDQAKAFLDLMPTAEELMPALQVEIWGGTLAAARRCGHPVDHAAVGDRPPPPHPPGDRSRPRRIQPQNRGNRWRGPQNSGRLPQRGTVGESATRSGEFPDRGNLMLDLDTLSQAQMEQPTSRRLSTPQEPTPRSSPTRELQASPRY